MPTPQDHDESAATELLTFRLADRVFGIEMSSVREIVRIPRITRVPLTPLHVLGVMNLRGAVLPVLNGPVRLGRPSAPFAEQARVLVLSVGDLTLGFAVDAVERILRTTPDQIEPVPEDAGETPRELLAGVVKENGRTLLKIAPESLLDRTAAFSAPGPALEAGMPGAEKSAPAVAERTRRVVVAEIGREEFGVDIQLVQEALRFTQPNPAPGAPPFLAGFIPHRSRVLPIIELRALMQRPDLAEETLRKTAQIRAEYARARDAAGAPAACARFLRNAHRLLESLGAPSQSLRMRNAELVQQVESARDAARLADLPDRIDALNGRLPDLEHAAADESDRRVLVINADRGRFGLAVDRVSQVLDVPESSLQPPPPIAQQSGVQLSALARIENPSRLVLLLDLAEMIAKNRLTTAPSAAASETAADMTTAATPTAHAQWVTFTAGDEVFGLPVADVLEIGRMETVTRVPGAPKFIQGVVNLRGEVVPAIDLRKRFSLESASPTTQTRIVYLRSGAVKIGVIVDRVLEILALSEVEPPPPAVCSRRVAEYLAGVARREDRVLLLLSAEKLLTKTEQESAEEASRGSDSRTRARKKP